MQTSSSSLANALGTLPQPLHHWTTPVPPSPLQESYRPEESRAFFNHFLQQKTREMNAAVQVPPSLSPSLPLRNPIKFQVPPQLQPPQHIASPIKTPSSKLDIVSLVKVEVPPDSSPDPLGVMANSSPVPVTPRKRKPVVEIQSPSVKRMQITRSDHAQASQYKPSLPLVPVTPSSKSITSAGSGELTPTLKRPVNLAYVAVPCSPWSTDYSQKNDFHTPNNSSWKEQKSMIQGTPDLGGYGESDSASPFKYREPIDSIKGSVRRTGERDDRGRLAFASKSIFLTPSFSTS